MTSASSHAKAQRGPMPLSLHIGLAMMEYQRLAAFGAAENGELEAMLEGIKKYQAHFYERPAQNYENIWREGEVRVLRHAGVKKINARPILLVPSLINRASILDLMPGQSFMEFLYGEGFDALLLDWGEPLRDESLSTCERLVTERLLPAIAYINGQYGAPVDALGYCMGGLMLLAAACRVSEKLRRVVLMGMPWDFHAGDGKMLSYVAAAAPAALQSIAARGHLPMGMIQSVFAAMNADRAARKFGDFSRMDQSSAEAKRFVAVEDWLNDGVDLPAGLARSCIADWYGENRTAMGRWMVAGQAVDPSTLSNHILTVAARKDRLVPLQSALALQKNAPHCDCLEPDTGHIGMMAGGKAMDTVWRPVAEWLNSA